MQEKYFHIKKQKFKKPVDNYLMWVYYGAVISRYGNGGDIMIFYPTLEREIAGRGIKKKTIAESINVCSKSLNNKLSGRVPFTWPEVETIKNKFFPDMMPEILFARAERDSA